MAGGGRGGRPAHRGVVEALKLKAGVLGAHGDGGPGDPPEDVAGPGGGRGARVCPGSREGGGDAGVRRCNRRGARQAAPEMPWLF